MEKKEFVPDESQQRVIDAEGGYHLVLAPPGCGKTQILTERIRRAHQRDGVPYKDMLCLTFINRAARAMVERINEHINDADVAEVYVGNVHRFCSKFLFDNGILAAETSIIDDEDTISIIARYQGEDEAQVAENSVRRREYFEIVHFSHFMHQIRMSHPRSLRLHPECCNSNDVAAMQKICEVQRMEFNVQAMVDIYDHSDFYSDASRMDGYDMGSQAIISTMLRKMTRARQYEQYKRENKLVDFEDLLIQSYDAMTAWDEDEHDGPYRRYKWIQVDEVQDLNPLQQAIIDCLLLYPNTQHPSSDTQQCPPFTLMYLGDEQQAIFSFMGARLATLDLLRQRCAGNIHHLATNHRSPAYLLDVFNEYARTILNIHPSLLPTPNNQPPSPNPQHPSLRILRSNVIDTEYFDVARMARNLAADYPDETTAIIVNSNTDADQISDELKNLQVPHFKVSGQDVFSSPQIKLLFAHFNILSNEHNFIAWARLMKGIRVFETQNFARNFMRSLLNRAMLPSDFLLYQDSTYMQEFCKAYEAEDIVVFDTETTGLNIFSDDIVQIAAVRMRQGHVVEGSQFSVFIQTSREIPAMLGDIPNPIIEELRHNEQLTPIEALTRFIDYVGDSVLLGHNVQFDYHILQNNLRRHLPQVDLIRQCPRVFDSLKLIRLLQPDLKEYKLKHLLEVLHLSGQNSHLADADVDATCSVVCYCYKKAQTVIPSQREFMAQKRVQNRVETLRRNYQQLYLHALETLYAQSPNTYHLTPDAPNFPGLVAEMLYVYDQLLDATIIQPVESIQRIAQYLACDVIDADNEISLVTQLGNHILELNTLKEADLCNSPHLHDRIFVTTVHKAKGLEFDNVIVFDAVDDRYPSYFNRDNPAGIAEDARKFYVAITRAKRRLYVSQCLSRIDFRGQVHQRQLTRFMNPILKYFD